MPNKTPERKWVTGNENATLWGGGFVVMARPERFTRGCPSPCGPACGRSARLRRWSNSRRWKRREFEPLRCGSRKRKRHPVGWRHRGVGAPGEIRTPDRSVRSRVLYPAELRARKSGALSGIPEEKARVGKAFGRSVEPKGSHRALSPPCIKKAPQGAFFMHGGERGIGSLRSPLLRRLRAFAVEPGSIGYRGFESCTRYMQMGPRGPHLHVYGGERGIRTLDRVSPIHP